LAFQKHFETFVNATYTDAGKAEEIIGKMNWTAWVREPGLPPNQLDFTTPDLTKAKKLASDYIANYSKSPDGFEEYKDWYSSLHVVFMEELIS